MKIKNFHNSFMLIVPINICFLEKKNTNEGCGSWWSTGAERHAPLHQAQRAGLEKYEQLFACNPLKSNIVKVFWKHFAHVVEDVSQQPPQVDKLHFLPIYEQELMSPAAALSMTYASDCMHFSHTSQWDRKRAITVTTACLLCQKGCATNLYCYNSGTK